MIRTLLGSTVLLSTVILSSYASAARTNPTPMLATPQLRFSGQLSANSLFFNNQRLLKPGDDKNGVCKRQKFGRGQLFTVDNSRFKINVDGKTDPGMEYGLAFVLDGNTDKDKLMREAYLYFGGTWGKVYFGDTYGVQDIMAFGGFDQWGGTGFINGGILDRVVNYTTGTLHSVDLVGDTSRNTKLSYLSPRWKGIQVGASYTPRTEHQGEAKIESRNSVKSPKVPFDTDNIALGANFIRKFESGFEMALSATSIFGQTHSEHRFAPARKNTASFAVGGTFSYKGVGFSAEFADNGHSRQLQEGGNKVNAGKFIDFGLSYKWGPSTEFSTGYYYGWRKALGGGIKSGFVERKATTKAVSAAIDQRLAPGLGIYVEYAYLQMKNRGAKAEADRINAIYTDGKCSGDFDGAVKSNVANVFIVGSRLVF